MRVKLVMKLGFQLVNLTASLRKRRVSIGRFGLEHAFADCFPVSEADQGTGEANTGEKAEATKQLEKEQQQAPP